MRRPSYVKQRRRLDSKVTFQRRGEASDEFNEPTEAAWQNLFDTRCAVYPAPGFERFDNSETTGVASMLVEVRAEARTRGLKSSDRAVVTAADSGIVTIYNIVSPSEQAERGDNIRIIVAADEGA